jgi:antitoxin component YwqK of YwqJK toxin-antitoxin module
MCSYSNNALDGQFVRYASSRKIETGYYRDGQLDGVYKKFHEKKDAVQQEVGYKNGQMHGMVKYFNEAGDVLMEYEYKNGEKIRGGIVENATSSTDSGVQ